jgi:RNA polymerase sigma factor (sigma-70 family)
MPIKTIPETTRAALHEFACGGEEASFRKVFEALGGLVFACALRRTGDAGMAEEVTQNVFAILARKAKRVAKHASPEGWIFTTTRLESAMAMRKRQQHQRKLVALADEISVPMEADDADAWRDAVPHLCESLDRLSEADREILLARFYSGISFKEIAQRFGKSEAACKMRVKRSLEKMKNWMSRRGVSLSTSVLATGLGAEWTQAAPASLSGTLPASALAAAPGLAIGKVLSNSLQTTKWLAGAALVSAGIVVAVSVWAMQSRREGPDKSTIAQKPERQVIKLGSALDTELRKRKPIRLGAVDRPAPAGDAPKAERRPGFWLPSVEMGNATARDALAQLRDQYRELGGDPSIAFDYELSDDEPDLLPVTFSLGNVTLEQALQRVAGDAGAELELRLGGFALVSLPEAGTEIETQRFRVPPDLLSSRGATQASELFPGVPATATLEFLPATSELVVTGDARIRARAAALVRGLANYIQTQVLLNVRFVYSPDDRLGIGARLLPSAEAQSLLEMVRDDQDCDLVANPAVVTRCGQISTMETLRAVEVGGEEAHVGIRMTVSPVRIAYNLSLVGEIHLSALGQLTPASLRGSATAGPGERVQSESVGLDLAVESGQSALFELLTGEDGERLMAIITPRLIDPSGQPIE